MLAWTWVLAPLPMPTMRDDRADADDDAQHGQRGPQLVPAQRAEGDFEDDEVAHGVNPPVARLSAPRCRRAQFLGGFKRSATGVVADHFAVAHDDLRFVYWAMSSSCVTMTMVMPCVVELLEHAHDLDAGLAVEVAGRLVGEQQRGSLTSARAMATRCCWPPESWLG